MKTHTKKGLFIALNISFLFFALISCKKDGAEKTKYVEPVAKMVLVYIAANNNLEYDALKCINKMEKGLRAVNGNLLVFIKSNSKNSHLLKIKYDDTDKIVSDTIKTYGYNSSSDPAFLSKIISDSRQLSPANNYGLVMWSHATSWTPYNNVKTKAFGNDNGVEMDIKELKNAIPSDFDYIMFDACSMGSIEVVYELKENAKYILASPSEVLSTSFPYDSITPHLFGNPDDLKIICKQFIEYYSSLSGAYASATVSLIETKELEPLSQYLKALLLSTKPKLNFNKDSLQRMDFDKQARVPAYDLLSFLEMNFVSEQYSEIKNQLGKTVIYKDHTKNFFNISIKSFSGLSVYLPIKNDPFSEYYLTLRWPIAAGWNNLFVL